MARVKKPDMDDWGKLKRVLTYLKGTKNINLTLTVDDMLMIKLLVNASDPEHYKYKGRRKIMTTLGGGATVSKSTKKKINTKSATKSEQYIWTTPFL